MRICHVTTYPPDLLLGHYERTPELAAAPYAVQHERLMALLYGWSDFVVRHARERGGEGFVVIANHARGQQQWAREHAMSDANRDTILLRQVKEDRPDVLFLEDCYNISASVVREARRCLSAGSLIVGYVGYVSSGVKAPDALHELDLVVTSAPPLAEQFIAGGARAIVMRHGFEARILTEVPATREPRLAASFIGSISATLHRERRELLEAINRILPLTVYSDSLRPRPRAAVRQFAAAVARRSLGAHLALLRSPLRRGALPAVHGAAMYDVLQRSDMSFNRHGGNVSYFVPNMRLFEVTGCGSCIVTDARPGLDALFEPEAEVVTYRSKEECAEKVRWLAAHPRERAAIAAAGQRRTLRDHTFGSRVGEMLDQIEAWL